jgi:hypothetical protein
MHGHLRPCEWYVFEAVDRELLSEKEKAVKIAVTTPTGHVGSAVADILLDSGDDISVKLLGRRPEALRTFVERGAQISIGSQDDPDYLVKATQGVDALFWATPPGYGSDDVRVSQTLLRRELGSNAQPLSKPGQQIGGAIDVV